MFSSVVKAVRRSFAWKDEVPDEGVHRDPQTDLAERIEEELIVPFEEQDHPHLPVIERRARRRDLESDVRRQDEGNMNDLGDPGDSREEDNLHLWPDARDNGMGNSTTMAGDGFPGAERGQYWEMDREYWLRPGIPSPIGQSPMGWGSPMPAGSVAVTPGYTSCPYPVYPAQDGFPYPTYYSPPYPPPYPRPYPPPYPPVYPPSEYMHIPDASQWRMARDRHGFDGDHHVDYSGPMTYDRSYDGAAIVTQRRGAYVTPELTREGVHGHQHIGSTTQGNHSLGTDRFPPSYRGDNVSSPASVDGWLLPGLREPVAFNELGSGPGDRNQGISTPETRRVVWQLPRDHGNSVLEVRNTGASESSVGCQGSGADAPGAQSWGTHNSMASEPLNNEQSRSNTRVSVPGTSAFEEIGVNGNSRAPVLGTTAPNLEPQISHLRGTAPSARSSEVFMSNIYNTEASVTTTLSNSMPGMGGGGSLQSETVRKSLVGMGMPRVSAWVTGETPVGVTPQAQPVDTPMGGTLHAQPRSMQPSWMDLPDSSHPASAIATYPSPGAYITGSATYAHNLDCQTDAGARASAAAGQSSGVMSMSTIAPVTLTSSDYHLGQNVSRVQGHDTRMITTHSVTPGPTGGIPQGGLGGQDLGQSGLSGVPRGNDNAGGSSSPEPRGKSRLSYKPDKYDGTTDWADYLRHFQMVSAWNRWNLEEKAVQLTINLTGIARQAWVDSFSDVSAPVSYESLVAALTQRFKPEGQEEAYKAEFRHRGRKREESFMEYGYALKRLAIRAFPRIKHDAREDIIVDQFLQGLVDMDMRRHVSLAHPSSLDQAVSLATEYEVITQSLKTPQFHKPKQVAAVKESGETNNAKTLQTLVGAINKQTRQLNTLVKPESAKSWTSGPVVCFACQQEGHIARYCPQYGNRGSSTGTQGKRAPALGAASTATTVNTPVQASTATTVANGVAPRPSTTTSSTLNE